jgi:HSP20 family protein
MYTKRNFGTLPRTIGGLMEDVINTGWNLVNEEVTSLTVPVNIKETSTCYELHLIAAGLKKEDFKLQIDRNLLNISYQHAEENQEQPQDEKWIKNEYRLRSFKKSFTLNEKIDSSKISAKYADGILVVTLPKKEVTEPTALEIPVN